MVTVTGTLALEETPATPAAAMEVVTGTLAPVPTPTTPVATIATATARAAPDWGERAVTAVISLERPPAAGWRSSVCRTPPALVVLTPVR